MALINDRKYQAPFTYTGDWDLYSYDNGRKWYAVLKTTGALTPIRDIAVDACLVPGGRPGTSGFTSNGGNGGAGGQMRNVYNIELSPISQQITIGGSNQNTTAFGQTASGAGAAGGSGGMFRHASGSFIGADLPVVGSPGSFPFAGDEPPFNTIRLGSGGSGGGSGQIQATGSPSGQAGAAANGFGGGRGGNGGALHGAGGHGQSGAANTGSGGGGTGGVTGTGTTPGQPGPGGTGSIYLRGVGDDGFLVFPPTVPSYIAAPQPIASGRNFSVSWGVSTDPQGQAVLYTLERSLDDGEFVVIAQTGNLFATNNIPVGTLTAQFRVRARNISNLYSDFIDSEVRDVIDNSPPEIDGADGDLGLQAGPFTQNYIVTDPDPGDVITVTERINGVQIRQYVATSGAQQSFTVDINRFLRLGNATHTITVVAVDQHGEAATRTWTFSREETQADLTLETPLEANDLVQRLIMNVNRWIAPGATFQVLASNNAFDAVPTWEDVTAAIEGNTIYYFTNDQKTAADWGLNFRFVGDRGSATELSWFDAAGGNFDNGVGTTSTSFFFTADQLIKGV